MEPPALDLSHLTESERRIIEKVMARQREEEDKEKEVFKKKQDEVLLLETAIRMRSEERQRIEGASDLSVTCQICLKTKFADGVGHVCHYCNVRCCARCGGKVSLRSNKVIWVCLVCRKKQELVIKTGQWVQTGSSHGTSHPGTPNFDPGSSRTPQLGRTRSLDKESTYPPLPSSPPNGRRGSLQRHSSATTRELRRQFSNETGSDSRHYHDAQGRYLSDSRNSSDHNLIRSPCDPADHHSRDDHRHERNRYRDRSRDPSPDVHGRRTRDHTPSRELSADRSRDRRSSWEHRDQQHHRDRLRSDDGHRSRDPSRERRDSSKDRCRRDSSRHRFEERRDADSHKYIPPSRPRTPREEDSARNTRSNHHHLDPNSALHSWSHDGSGGGNRHQSEAVVRNDSLSSDQSENVRPPPPKHRPKKGKKPRQRSFSSSDDEIRSTPEYSSCEEPEIESESISEKGEPQHFHNDQKVGVSVDEGTHESASSTRRWGHYNPGPDHLRKKTVRFHRASSQEPFWKDIGWPDQHTKDSGIDTSSSATLNEDTNNKHPVSWKQSTDASKLFGHMILKKRPLLDSGTGVTSVGLGMRVVGGRIMDNGRLGAVVENIKKGSIADTIGRIKPGDEVLEWNGRPLRDKTYEEVYEIIAESKQEPQVELRVCRSTSNTSNSGPRDPSHRRPPHLEIHPELLTREGNPHYGHKYMDHRPSVTVTSPPRSPGPATHRTNRSPTIGGRVQVKLWYEAKMLQLVVTIVRAVELPPRINLLPRNPYVKAILLPDKSEKSKRRTKTIANTNEPKWNQTFLYAPLRRSDLHSRNLEIGVWDYDKYSASDFLGEVLIDLGTSPLDNEGKWYLLTTHEDNLSAQLRRQMMFADAEASSSVTSTDRLSPPSTNSRLSDSELSEYDFEDRFFTQTERRMMAVDGASISSVGSHCSPTFLPEDNREERRSRRDHLTEAEGRHRSTSEIGENDVLYAAVRRQETGIPDPRGRSRSVTPGNGIRGLSTSRRAMSMSSRSLSPPEMRPRFHTTAIPSVSASRHSFQQQRSAMSAMTFKKRQLPQIPVAFSRKNSRTPMSLDFDERGQLVDMKTSAKGTSGAITPMAMFSDSEVFSRHHSSNRRVSVYGQPRTTYESVVLRRGGGSRMAAALGVGTSPMVSPEIGSDSESSSMTKYSINSAFGTQLHKSSRTLGEFTSRMQGYGPVHPSQITSKEKVDGSLSDTAVGSLTDKITILDNRPASGTGSYTSGSKMAQFMGLSKKSSSTSELSVTVGYHH